VVRIIKVEVLSVKSMALACLMQPAVVYSNMIINSHF
jgi:hypothetical protein